MRKFQKGEKVWVVSTKYDEVRLAEHEVAACGPQVVTVTVASPASSYVTKVPIEWVHATKRAALEMARGVFHEKVEALENQLTEARAVIESISADIDKE